MSEGYKGIPELYDSCIEVADVERKGIMEKTIWFRHDTGALSDRLMQRLMRRHGMEGVGVYWGVVEALYQVDGLIPLDHIEDLAFTFHVDEETVETIVKESGLFKIDGDCFYSERILREFKARNEISKKARQSANARWEKKSEEEEKPSNEGNSSDAQCDHNATAMRTQCERNASTVQYNTVQYNKNKKKSGDSDESPPPSVEQAGELAHLIEELHRKQDQKFRGKPESWTNDIEKLIRIDGRDPPEIRKVITWAKQPDSFWFPNIISGKKLREKYPTLKAQMEREKKLKKPKYKITEGFDYDFEEDNFQEA